VIVTESAYIFIVKKQAGYSGRI